MRLKYEPASEPLHISSFSLSELEVKHVLKCNKELLFQKRVRSATFLFFFVTLTLGDAKSWCGAGLPAATSTDTRCSFSPRFFSEGTGLQGYLAHTK